MLDKVTHNVLVLADGPALVFRQSGKLFKNSTKSKCSMIVRQPVYWQAHVVRSCFVITELYQTDDASTGVPKQ
jgi:hypothetical protein